MWGGDQDAFLESMAEAGTSVVEALDRADRLYQCKVSRLVYWQLEPVADGEKHNLP